MRQAFDRGNGRIVLGDDIQRKDDQFDSVLVLLQTTVS